MRVIFKSVKLKNFMSYDEAEITLDKHGFILVSGINNNPIDNAKSNGTGKSSLFSAISWALTGLTVGGGKEVSNIYLSGSTSVDLIFTVDNVKYEICRTKNPSNLKLYVDGVDKSGKGIRDTEKILAEYLPDLTHTLLNSVIILGQGLPQRFTSNSPSGRKEVLEKLSNSDFMITDLKNRVATRNTRLKSDLRKVEDNITSDNAKCELINEEILKLNSELETYTDEYYQQLCEKVSINKKLVDEYTEKVSESEQTISNLLDNISKINDEMSIAHMHYEQQKAEVALQDVSSVTQDITEIKAKIKVLSHEITHLDSVTDVCPTCGQKLPNVTKIDTTEKKNELNLLQIKLKSLQDQEQRLTEENTQLLDKFNQEFELSQKANKARVNDLNVQLKNENNTKAENSKLLTEAQQQYSDANVAMNVFNSKKLELENKITEQVTQRDILQNKILCYNNNVNELQAHIDVISKMNTMLTRDFRGYLLLTVIEYIAKRAKQYTIELFGTDKLDFVLDGNNINITYDSKDYEVLSGGEKQKIDVIIQLAIRDMLCKYLNFSSNILVLDEITDSLDIVGSQKMFNLIANKLTDVEAVYIISHHQDDFEIPYDDQINIVKGEDRISRILM